MYAIVAGDEFAESADGSSNRTDPFAVASPFNFVCALLITLGSQSFIGSASVLSPHWVLTAEHNLDINDDALLSKTRESLSKDGPYFLKEASLGCLRKTDPPLYEGHGFCCPRSSSEVPPICEQCRV